MTWMKSITWYVQYLTLCGHKGASLFCLYNSSCSTIAHFAGQYNTFTSKFKYHTMSEYMHEKHKKYNIFKSKYTMRH